MTNFDLTHFNSGTQKEADFLASFIARQDSLRFFLSQLRNTHTKQVARHHLIVAPRGYGKTSLLRRIKIAVRDKDEFQSRFIALSFREEQHNVISLDIFWRNCILSLLETREEEQAAANELGHLDEIWKQGLPRSHLPRDEQDGAPMWQAFNAHCEQLGRRPVLLIDNLDTLLAGLPENHQWTLRTLLQKANGPVLLAASSKFPESINDPAAPFHDFFRVSTLKALSDREVLACLSELAKRRGDKGISVRTMLENDPGRITSLNTMAGGNPRTLGVLYSVLESHMSDDVLAQLTAMLDTFTGWYQARTEELSLQSRAVFDALALNWDPMTASAIGAVTGLDTPTVSSHLNRLEKAGYAETIQLTKSKRSKNVYQVSERFFNIWYLMRNGSRHTRQKIRFLTIFLRSCFSSNELLVMATKKLNQTSSAESILAFAASIPDQSLRLQLVNIAADELPEFKKLDEISSFVEEISASLKPADLSDESESERRQYLKQTNDILSLATEGKIEQAMEQCRKLISSQEGWKLGMAWFLYGLVLSNFSDKNEEAENAFSQALNYTPNNASVHQALGDAFRSLKKYDEAEQAYRKAIDLDNDSANSWHTLGEMISLNETRAEEALAAFRQALNIDETRILTWLRLGKLHESYLNQFDMAEDAYRRALEIDDKDVLALTYLGNVLARKEESLHQAEELYRRALSLNEKSPRTLTDLATMLGKDQKRLVEAEEVFKKISIEHPNFGPGWYHKAQFLQSIGRFDEAEAAYLKCVSLQGGRSAAWVRLGMLYEDDLIQYDKAEKAYRKAVESNEKFHLPWVLLGALYQDHLGKFDDALQAYKVGIKLSSMLGEIIYSNLVFLNAFNLNDISEANRYAELAKSSLSVGGRQLIESALHWPSDKDADIQVSWALLNSAISSTDENVWEKHSDDIERILGFSLGRGQGAWVKNQMEINNYPLEYAPVYHAYCAVLEGDSYLEKINPEVRGVAEKIFERLDYVAKSTR